MELPRPTDLELQLALLNAISQCADGTAVAEELRPIAEEALNLTIPEDQKDEWKNLISWALINMRDQKVWLQSPHHEPGTQGASPESQMWVKTNRPSADPQQRIWKISDQGVKVLQGGPQNDPTVFKKKSRNQSMRVNSCGTISRLIKVSFPRILAVSVNSSLTF